MRADLTGLVEGRLAITVDWMSRALQGMLLVDRRRYLTWYPLTGRDYLSEFEYGELRTIDSTAGSARSTH